MPQLTFPLGPDGLIVDALVGIDGDATSDLVAAGQPVPSPRQVRALIDTGSDVTVVSASVLTALGLTPHFQTTTQTVAASIGVNIFTVSLSITDNRQPGAPLFVHPTLAVMEMSGAVAGFDVLIGMDVLANCRTLIDGPQRRFTIDF
jgi:hypothetical protein